MSEKLLLALKYNLVTYNIFFVVTGVITLYVGISVQLTNETYSPFWYPGFNLPIFCISTGAVILLVAAAGFYGAIREKYLMNVLFAGLMVVMLILQLALCIAGFALRTEMSDEVQKQLKWTLEIYDKNSDVVQQWDKIQEDFKCCGVQNASDWLKPLNTEDSLVVPLSCCHNHGVVVTCNVHTAFTRGCADVFSNYMNSKMNSIGDTGVFLTLMQGLIAFSVISALWTVKIAREGR